MDHRRASPSRGQYRRGGGGWWSARLVAIELTTFATYARREITWAYPGSYDQSAYLTSTYILTRDMSARRYVPRRFARTWTARSPLA